MPITNVTILDGGLGTALESEIGPDVSQSALWSTQAVLDHPDAVISIHRSYARAGARILETATYQAAISNLVDSGNLTEAESHKAMLKAIDLARQARATSLPCGDKIQIALALSLGPLGATLRPTQEFLGFYPPPFGPQEYSNAERRPNVREFTDPIAEAAAVDALAQFHLERLLVYASDEDLWGEIDYIAFETVLLKREVIAIRKAMTLFAEQISRGRDFSKPWWISFVCPELTTDISSLTRAALDEAQIATQRLITPSGIGINCTSIQSLPVFVAQVSDAVTNLQSSQLSLVLYPNGGEYDTINECWKPRTDQDDERWATRFGDIVVSLAREGRWKNIIAGGCCRTDPSYIAKLAEVIKSKEEILIQISSL